MNQTTTITAGLASLLCFLAASGVADENPAAELSVNPFERPAWVSEALIEPASDQAVTQNHRIDLRAILSAGEQSLANVGGNIIAIGEETNGYVLKAIINDEAVFSMNEQTIRVSVVSDKDDSDETE